MTPIIEKPRAATGRLRSALSGLVNCFDPKSPDRALTEARAALADRPPNPQAEIK